MVKTENHLEGESGRESTHLNTLLDRYVGAIRNSADHIVDIFPAVFYEKEELRGNEFYPRIWRATESSSVRNFDTAMDRYRRMETPPIYEEGGQRWGAGSIYRINRPYYEAKAFYHTSAYEAMYNFLVDGIKEKRKIETDPKLEIPIIELNLSKRVYDNLVAIGVNTVAELAQTNGSKILLSRNMGDKSLIEIIAKLDEKNIPHKLNIGEFT